MELIELPQRIREIIDLEISTNERVLWVGQPNPRRLMMATIGLVLFAIPWTAFALFWICGASGFKWPTWEGPQSLFPLFGLPFVFIGIGMLSAPYWAKRSALNSAYLITNKRAVCFTWKLFSAEIASYDARKLKDMEKTMTKNGNGDLIFERKNQGSGRYAKIGFIGIDDVRGVERIIKDIILKEIA